MTADPRLPDIAWITEPRFQGGTSSAVASELTALSGILRPRVYGLMTDMCRGTAVAPQLTEALTRLRIDPEYAPDRVSADVVIFHNPSCLKFQSDPGVRIIARHLIVVTHENFLRPGGHEAFDVAGCLKQLSDNSVALSRSLAPVSDWNRQTVTDWLAAHPEVTGWDVLPGTWHNICDFTLVPPSQSPSDRRGRHSRPGFEKFPAPETLLACFPPEADQNVILGADSLIGDPACPPHLTLIPFRGLPVAQYFDMIDFMVYFTAPTWRESFGRVLAEAVAAGKIVITDPQTARSFERGVIGADPGDVSDIVKSYIDDPDRYQSDVRAGQRSLDRYSAASFREHFRQVMAHLGEPVS